MKIAIFLASLTAGAIALACDRPNETIVVYIEPDSGSLNTENLPNDEADIPCAPRHVLQTVCQKCHTRPMRNGAPFPLERRSDIVVHMYGGVVVRELMIEDLNARRMPLSPVTITDTDRDTLLEWLNAGAPSAHDAGCDIPLAAINQEDAG